MLVYQSVYIFVEDIRYSNPTIFSKKYSQPVAQWDWETNHQSWTMHVVDEVNFSSSE